MAPKRPLEAGDAESQIKKRRSGFNVGPDNLPDGTWRRKVIKIKHELIHKAKVQKSYAKIKAREPVVKRPVFSEEQPTAESEAPATQELHPDRQAIIDAPRQPSPVALPSQESQFEQQQQSRTDRRAKRPAYFKKEQEFAIQKKSEAEARRAEFERRDKERKEKIEERERFRRAMAKARTGGKNGQRKLGKESTVLLEKVKRLVAEK